MRWVVCVFFCEECRQHWIGSEELRACCVAVICEKETSAANKREVNERTKTVGCVRQTCRAVMDMEIEDRARAEAVLNIQALLPGMALTCASDILQPLRLTVGGRGLKEGIFEMKWRTAKEVSKVAIVDAATVITAAVRQAAGQA